MKFTPPHLLLPPHASPLGMAIDNARKLPVPFTGNLVLPYHGYRKQGHRVVAYKLDPRGHPVGAPLERIGTPVDVSIAGDGSIFITEDRNGTVLRLTRSRTHVTYYF